MAKPLVVAEGDRIAILPDRDPPASLRTSEPLHRGKWTAGALYGIALVVALCLSLALSLPAETWSAQSRSFLAVLGLIGVWRYSWWLTHLVRAMYYRRRVFPAIRAKADAAWSAGWRPRRIHLLMTTFRERRETAEAVVAAVCREIRQVDRPATIWIGSAEADDEQTLLAAFRQAGADLDIDLRFIRQSAPGKRVALALVLRAYAREGMGAQDVALIMDGDFILDPGAVAGCLSLFAVDPALQAVTTDEEALVVGPGWFQSWLAMRFAQRRIAMASHAVSERVLTLTGRFSVFRATHIVEDSFIRLIEADHLDHWLWGTFRFLSGDDKSTWYGLLQRRAKMLYVPDVRGVTIEVIEGNGVERMVQNLKRWSGNVLRNGSRAISLGPWRMPPFIWWCLIDQRIAMWTTLLGPLLALTMALKLGASFLLAYAVYVVLTRLALASVLWAYAPRVDLNFIWALYLNQIVNAGVKLYVLWRLPQQRWANRGNQSSGTQSPWLLAQAQRGMATYLTILSMATLVLMALVLTGAVTAPWALVFAFASH